MHEKREKEVFINMYQEIADWMNASSSTYFGPGFLHAKNTIYII